MGAVRRTTLMLVLAASALTPQLASAIPTTATAKATARYDLTLVNGVFAASTAGNPIETVVTNIGDVTFSVSSTPGINCPINNIFCIWQATASADASAEDGSVEVQASFGTFSATIVASALAATQLTITGTNIDTATDVFPGDGTGIFFSTGAGISLMLLDGIEQGFIDEVTPLVVNLTPGTHTLTWTGVFAQARAEQDRPVPAPATLALLAAGLTALAATRRR